MHRLRAISSHCQGRQLPASSAASPPPPCETRSASSSSSHGRKSPYEILEVPQTATDAEIKKGYRKLAVKWHPDKNPNSVELAEQKFKEVGEAYAVLSDVDKRAVFDRYGWAGLDAGGAGSGPSSAGGGFGPGMGGRSSFPFGGGGAGADPSDIFKQFFGEAGIGGDSGMGGFRPGRGSPAFGGSGGFQMPFPGQQWPPPFPGHQQHPQHNHPMQQAPGDRPDLLPAGTAVRLQGLSSEADLNGEPAAVAGYIA